MQQLYGEIQSASGSVFLIGPETEQEALKLMEKQHATIPLLHDTDGAVMESYKLAFDLPEGVKKAYAAGGIDLPNFNPQTGWRLPIPATFVVDQAQKISARYVNANQTFRMEPAAVLEAVKAAAQG